MYQVSLPCGFSTPANPVHKFGPKGGSSAGETNHHNRYVFFFQHSFCLCMFRFVDLVLLGCLLVSKQLKLPWFGLIQWASFGLALG